MPAFAFIGAVAEIAGVPDNFGAEAVATDVDQEARLQPAFLSVVIWAATDNKDGIGSSIERFLYVVVRLVNSLGQYELFGGFACPANEVKTSTPAGVSVD